MIVTEPSIAARQITLHGQVQGVGLRPSVARLADELKLAGRVSNTASGVVIHVEGPPLQVDAFERRLARELPDLARLSNSDTAVCDPRGMVEFKIDQSTIDGSLTTRVPPDVATCDACLSDVTDRCNRRCGYEFTTCTDCGPRYSIIDSLPYDRVRTSMQVYEACESCGREYTDPQDRRFHSQTNSCSSCGPRCSTNRKYGSVSDAIPAAASAILDGRILALKGVGGYQLIVDATNPAAIDRLRQRKRRAARPLAVMVADLAEAECIANLNNIERILLCGPECPIVLVRRRDANRELPSSAIHPGLNEIGLVLPATPLHWLLLREVGRPLVITSGNVEGDPLVTSGADAEHVLADVGDVWLHHDRDIVRPVDDSVVRVIAKRPVTIRCARGLSPLALPALEEYIRRYTRDGLDIPPVLATGGHQKCSIALFNGQQAVLGPHIGDLESLATRQRFIEDAEAFQSLYRCRPQLIVHDQHPDYFTSFHAQAANVDSLAVQHHHAHIVSAMVENNWLEREVLGVAFDGTGYGTDGTVWGGEFLRSTVLGFERVGHLRHFSLPGGEAAVHEPWRVAVSLLRESGCANVIERFDRVWAKAPEVRAVMTLAGSSLAPRTTSAGRLFDGVASLILGDAEAGFDGYPAMRLESIADVTAIEAYDVPVAVGDSLQLDWRPMVRQIVCDIEQRCPRAMMAAKVHRGLAKAIAQFCMQFELPIVLTGGVFQNRLLTEWVADELVSGNADVGCHSRIPPNDGGLAAGQLAIGLAQLTLDSRGA